MAAYLKNDCKYQFKSLFSRRLASTRTSLVDLAHRIRPFTDQRGENAYRTERAVSFNTTPHGGVLRFRADQSPQICGIRSTRGTREYNEDRYQRCVIRLGDRDCLYVAVFDGHGGSRASDFCSAHLHRNIESQYASLLSSSREESPDLSSSAGIKKQQTLVEESIRRGFLETDRSFLATHSTDSIDGTTASVCIVQIIDELPDVQNTVRTSNKQNLLSIGHVGDSRILMCDNVTGRAQQLTVDHHPSVKEEQARILSQGGFISADSFGEEALMGMAANSRAIGVARLKHMNDGKGCGLTADPWITTRILDSRDAFLVLVTDGVTNTLTNQEIVDVVKLCKDPTTGAISIVNNAEQLGAYDNCSAMVIRLGGWPLNSTPPGTRDFTKNLRRFRVNNSLNNPKMNVSLTGTTSDDEQTDGTISALLSPDRFVIELFDVIGKDIGISAFPSFSDTIEDNHSRSIGRLTLDEFRTGVQVLNVHLSSDKEKLPSPLVIEKIFQTEVPDVDHHSLLAKKNIALSAADILRLLNSLQVRVTMIQK